MQEFVKAGLLALAIVLPTAAWAAEPTRLIFESHGAFFSIEFHQKTLIDPQVFAKESEAPKMLGPQGITHEAGLRNARLSDPLETSIFTAVGKPLPLTLGQWLVASGSAEIEDQGDGSRVTMRFTHLVPNGTYSVFENHFDTKPPSFTPLDGTGRSNDFRADADGSAAAVVASPHRLTHDNGILVVYHSDGTAHGIDRGAIGVVAHHQLVVRIPVR